MERNFLPEGLRKRAMQENMIQGIEARKATAVGGKLETQTLSNSQEIVKELPHKNGNFKRNLCIPDHITMERRGVSQQRKERQK